VLSVRGRAARRTAKRKDALERAVAPLTERFTSWLSVRVAATDQLSLVFAALADPTRRGILAALTLGDATVTELTEPLPISMPAVSRHLKVLEGAALISRSREGKWQRSHLQAAPLRDAAVWMERFRGFWDSSFDRLDAHLATLQQEQENR
jgi:DNA-binding transcriptional ArsR family regulator